MTYTYNPRLAKVKVDPHAKNQGHRSNGSNRRVPTANGHMHTHGQTDRHTHGRYQTYYLPCYAVNKYGNFLDLWSTFWGHPLRVFGVFIICQNLVEIHLVVFFKYKSFYI